MYKIKIPSMIELLFFFAENLLSPPILFFLLGTISGCLKSNLEIPEQISKYLAIYLIIAIGFKGGVAISETNNFDLKAILTISVSILTSFIQPFIGYFFLKHTTRIDKLTAAALAAHYGSVSLVTFVTAINFLELNSTIYSGYIISVLSLMEAPAILSGILIAHTCKQKNASNKNQLKPFLLKEVFTNGSILLLLGSFFIGWVSGTQGMQKMDGFVISPFQGLLSLFLLDMGLLITKHLAELKEFTLKLALFGIYMPLIGSVIGISLSMLIGLDIGTGFLFTVLISSASYIVVTAAMRISLPEAKATIYIPMTLAVTFPFNITLGIPFYFTLAQKFLAE